MRTFTPILVLSVLLGACRTTALPETDTDLVDPDASAETRALFENLKRLAPDHVLFGHQDALAYGVTWEGEEGRSDVHDVTGAYPALYGWDVGDLENGAEENLDGVSFEDMKDWIRQGYRRGGAITISWHMDNPVTGGNSWDTTSAVHTILPGGAHHAWYVAALDRFAAFVRDLNVGPLSWLGFGGRVPLIFRPFHEVTGAWFWWGRGNTSAEDYKALWRFTVEYLRDEKDLDNLLFAYSTDVFYSEADYMEFYPGDEYVDIMGMDDYRGVESEDALPDLSRRLHRLVEMAELRGKIPALTETGVEAIPFESWWTERLLKGILADSLGRRIAYVMVWRNASEDHHFAPFPGHPAAADFVRFYEHPFVLFGDEVPDLYE